VRRRLIRIVTAEIDCRIIGEGGCQHRARRHQRMLEIGRDAAKVFTAGTDETFRE
jgi:hypothetical protein